MKKIVGSEALKTLESSFLKVFKNKDSFGNPFTEDIQTKLLLFPTDGYYLQEDQFNVLCQINRHIGEEEFFISEIEGDCFSASLSSQAYEHGHWVGNVTSMYEDYKSLPIVLENAIYSKKGNWGLMTSHEGHAILGGSKEFIVRFQGLYPKYRTSQERFFEYWKYNKSKYNSNIEWLSNFLRQFS